MREVITIQIIRPQLEGLSGSDKRALIERMSKDIAAQIVKQEDLRIMSANIEYWQHKLIEWQIEDQLNEIKYGKRE